MKDILGAACSGVCVIHCSVLPLLAATGTSFLGLAALSSESAHLWLSVAMITIALLAFPSALRIHKRLLPSVLALIGCGLMAGALFASEKFELYWTLISCVLLISGHLLNRHFLKLENNQ